MADCIQKLQSNNSAELYSGFTTRHNLQQLSRANWDSINFIRMPTLLTSLKRFSIIFLRQSPNAEFSSDVIGSDSMIGSMTSANISSNILKHRNKHQHGLMMREEMS